MRRTAPRRTVCATDRVRGGPLTPRPLSSLPPSLHSQHATRGCNCLPRVRRLHSANKQLLTWLFRSRVRVAPPVLRWVLRRVCWNVACAAIILAETPKARSTRECCPNAAIRCADPSPRHSQPPIRCGRTGNCKPQHHHITIECEQAIQATQRSAYRTFPLRTSLRTHPLAEPASDGAHSVQRKGVQIFAIFALVPRSLVPAFPLDAKTNCVTRAIKITSTLGPFCFGQTSQGLG
jgi:hypothetical protein